MAPAPAAITAVTTHPRNQRTVAPKNQPASTHSATRASTIAHSGPSWVAKSHSHENGASAPESDWSALREARLGAASFSQSADFRDLAQWLRAFVAAPTGTQALKNAAGGVLTQLGNAVVAKTSDRRATGAPGRNWLFFGHQRSDCDFFYADELNALKTSGLLTRLSLAWSRDGDKKFYVQDRMREVGRELWTWLAEGANIYICGDARRMAKDVERALVDIVAQFGARTTDEAVSFVGELKKQGRFQQDVY